MEDDPKVRYVVTVWNHGSEASYSFGPFKTEAAVDRFIDKVESTSYKEVSRVILVNPPSYFGTGHEMRLD